MLRDRSNKDNYLDLVKTQYPEIQLVHRLDKFTSGVLIAAKHDGSKRLLSKAFASRSVSKFYVAVVSGHMPRGLTLKIDLPLKAGRKSKYRVAGLREEIRASASGWSIESDEGFSSLTLIRTLDSGPMRSLLVCQPKTGRTHQIRVHLAWIGHPIVGDPLYGVVNSPEQAAERLALHAHKLSFPSVSSAIVSPIPKGFLAMMDASKIGVL